MPKQLHVITVIADLCAEKRLTNKGHGPRGKLDFCFGLVFFFFYAKGAKSQNQSNETFPLCSPVAAREEKCVVEGEEMEASSEQQKKCPLPTTRFP